MPLIDVPIDTLPSYVLGVRLSRIQQKMDRVTGSNLGDRYLASMVFYADGPDVDKRTDEFLKQVQRSDPALGNGIVDPCDHAPAQLATTTRCREVLTALTR